MKKKIPIVFFLIFSFLFSLSAETTPTENIEDLPQSIQDLRRFEIVTLGSLPFVTLDVNLGYSTYKWATNGFDGSYFPNPFASSEKRGYTTDEQVGVLVTSLCISLGIGVTDLVITNIKRGSKKRNERKNSLKDINIIPISEDPEAIRIVPPEDEIKNEEVTSIGEE